MKSNLLFIGSGLALGQLVWVSASEPAEIVSAKSMDASALDESKPLPESVQIFPPGRHSINAAGSDGKKLSLDVTITEATAKAVKDSFDQMMIEAKAGRGPKPYLDFNHDDKEAAGWPADVFWAGNDPATGGVRVKMVDESGDSTWSTPGAAAIKGKAYRSFSPNFQFDRESGSVVGTGPNMGGLVNRPAFRQIQPVSAKAGADDNAEPKNQLTMNRIQQALLAAGLISATATTDDVMASEFATNFAAVRSRNEKDQQAVLNVTAKSTADADANKELRRELSEMRATNAENVVAKAITEGRIAPKDAAARAHWVDVIAKDPKAASLLESISSKASPTTDIVDPAKGAKAAAGAVVIAVAAKADPFIVAAKALVDSGKEKTMNAAVATVAASEPALYEAYREGLLFVQTGSNE